MNKTEIKDIKVRNTNIELLRIIAMLSIVTSHIVTHSVIPQWRVQDSFNLGKDLFFLNVIIPCGNISNDLFLIISGYFTVAKGKTVNLINISKKLLYQLFFSVIILVVISNLLFRFCAHGDKIHMINVMDINNSSWYIGYYFGVILIGAIWLNEFLVRRTKEIYMCILFSEFAILQFSWSAKFLEGIGGNDGLMHLVVGLFLYSLGGYIRKYEPFKVIRTFTLVLIIAILYFLLFVTTINFNEIVHHYDQNFFSIISATCLFELFRRITIPNLKIVNFIGASTFMVYLIHDNSFFYNLWNTVDWMNLFTESLPAYWAYLLLFGILTFLAGVLCYILYLVFMKALVKMKFIFLRNV